MAGAADSDPGVRDAFIDPQRPPAAELGIGLSGPFSLALTGDCIPSHPITPFRANVAGFAEVMKLLAEADIACGNLETSIFDIASFKGHPYCWDDDVPLLASPTTARDLAALGFDMLARANNHALDWGLEGMRETSRLLDAAGIAHAGVGESLGLARRAAYVEIPQGRIAMLSVATTFRPTTEALDPHDATPGRPGLSAIRLRQIDVVTPDELILLRQLGAKSDAGNTDVLKLFGRSFEAGPSRGFRHEPDAVDMAAFVREVRHARQNADFVIAMVHAHEFARDDYPEPPSEALKNIAYAAIEAGAGTVSVSGLHHLGPVDLYRGRPIFYGLGNFIWGDIQEFLPSETWKQNADLLNAAFASPDRATAADLNAAVNAGYYAHQEIFETILPIIRFDGSFVEAVLHPVDLGYGDPLTRSGIPRLAGPEQAERILRRIRDVSEEFGCIHRIEIEGGVGLLRAKP